MPCPECGSDNTVSGCDAGLYSACLDCPANWTIHQGDRGRELCVIKDKHGHDPRMYRCECGHVRGQHYMSEEEHPDGWFEPFECTLYNCECTEFKMKDDRFILVDGNIVRKE